MPLIPVEEAIRAQANLVAAEEFLLDALSTGPKYCSTLAWGIALRELPPQAVRRAKDKLRIEQYTDRDGNTCWRLPEQPLQSEEDHGHNDQ